jgi:hypothetical protein
LATRYADPYAKIPLALTIVPTTDALSYIPFQSEPLGNERLKLTASTDVPVFDVAQEARAQVRARGRYSHGFGVTMAAGR